MNRQNHSVMSYPKDTEHKQFFIVFDSVTGHYVHAMHALCKEEFKIYLR